MSKATLTKIVRKFNISKDKVLFRRDEPLPIQTDSIQVCQYKYCSVPGRKMLVAPGTIQFMHKQCREEKRNARNQMKPRARWGNRNQQ